MGLKNTFSTAALGQRLIQKGRDLIFNTPAEFYIGAAIMGAAAFAALYHVNAEREGRIPIAFSECGKIIKSFRDAGEAEAPLTTYYCSLNDVLMKVFEASNTAMESSRSHDRFATELDYRMDPALKVHRQIPEFTRETPDQARKALAALQHLDRAARDLPPIVFQIASTWSYKGDHYTRREKVGEECDDKGKNCQDIYENVYDHTRHTYTYHAAAAQRGTQLWAEFLQKHPDLGVAEKLRHATRTDVENEYAIERSMRDILDGKIPTPEQALKYATMWATGSTLESNRYAVLDFLGAMQKGLPSWKAAQGTARDQAYDTKSKTDDGPAEYQLAQNAKANAEGLQTSITKITGGVRMAFYSVPKLEQDIRQYIKVVLDKHPGDADALRKSIMSNATGTYKANFSNGLDVQPFRWEEVALGTLAGIILGGLLGAGVDRGLNAYRRRSYSHNRF